MPVQTVISFGQYYYLFFYYYFHPLIIVFRLNFRAINGRLIDEFKFPGGIRL